MDPGAWRNSIGRTAPPRTAVQQHRPPFHRTSHISSRPCPCRASTMCLHAASRVGHRTIHGGRSERGRVAGEQGRQQPDVLKGLSVAAAQCSRSEGAAGCAPSCSWAARPAGRPSQADAAERRDRRCQRPVRPVVERRPRPLERCGQHSSGRHLPGCCSLCPAGEPKFG
jgi:hypothetical protein